MIKDYEHMPLGIYGRVMDVIKERDGDELHQQVGVIAALAGMTEDEVLALPLDDYAKAAADTDFLRHPMGPLPEIRKEYTAGDFTLVPVKDYKHLTAGQYIDFQTFTKGRMSDASLLSILLVPKGRRYSDGYDPEEVRDALDRDMTATDAVALLAFFLTRYVALMRSSLTYCERAVGRMKPGAKRTRMQEQIDGTRRLLSRLGVG